jgi:hypothetical protein
MAWFVKYYRHDDCRIIWTDEWSCACNDDCPKCGAEVEPYDWEDISVVLNRGSHDIGWVVRVSPPEAEDKPKYIESYFDHWQEAEDFARRETKRLERI